MEHLAQLVREKKTRMHFGSLIKNLESIINITKKLPSLVNLVTSIEFNNSFRVENHIYWTSV